MNNFIFSAVKMVRGHHVQINAINKIGPKYTMKKIPSPHYRDTASYSFSRTKEENTCSLKLISMNSRQTLPALVTKTAIAKTTALAIIQK